MSGIIAVPEKKPHPKIRDIDREIGPLSRVYRSNLRPTVTDCPLVRGQNRNVLSPEDKSAFASHQRTNQFCPLVRGHLTSLRPSIATRPLADF